MFSFFKWSCPLYVFTTPQWSVFSPAFVCELVSYFWVPAAHAAGCSVSVVDDLPRLLLSVLAQSHKRPSSPPSHSASLIPLLFSHLVHLVTSVDSTLFFKDVFDKDHFSRLYGIYDIISILFGVFCPQGMSDLSSPTRA